MIRWHRSLLAFSVAALAVACSAPQQEAPPQQQSPAAAKQDPVERGEYLVKIMGCNDCHTPLKFGPEGPMPDMTRMLSGHPEGAALPAPPAITPEWFLVTQMTAFVGPWGTSYAINITPDSLTGIGIWTEDMFTSAMRTGKHMGTSRPILPPMPWQGISALTDEDMHALYAYLRAIPPIPNKIPDAVIAPPPAGAPGGGH